MIGWLSSLDSDRARPLLDALRQAGETTVLPGITSLLDSRRFDILVIAEPLVTSESAANLDLALEGSDPPPAIVLLTDLSHRNLHRLGGLPVVRLLPLDIKPNQLVRSLIEVSGPASGRDAAMEALERCRDLPDLASRFARLALAREPPFRTVDQACSSVGRGVSTVRVEWCSCARGRVGLKTFLAWIQLAALVDLLRRGSSPSKASNRLGISERSGHRLARRLTGRRLVDLAGSGGSVWNEVRLLIQGDEVA